MGILAVRSGWGLDLCNTKLEKRAYLRVLHSEAFRGWQVWSRAQSERRERERLDALRRDSARYLRQRKRELSGAAPR